MGGGGGEQGRAAEGVGGERGGAPREGGDPTQREADVAARERGRVHSAAEA